MTLTERPGPLAAVISAYAVVDRPPEPDLTAIARLAARIAGVESATVNLLDDRWQHQVATAGFVPERIARAASMCHVTVELDEPVYVPDASRDPRFAGSPWVTGELGRVRFYAASQLRTPAGPTVGTLCVFDDQPRTLGEHQRRALDDLADQVVAWLERRRREAELAAAVDDLERSNADLAAFAGRIAHDLRNPLTAITGFLTLADRRFGDEMNDRLRSIIGTALEAAGRMTRLVEDMLAFSSLGAEPMLVPTELTAVAAAVDVDTESSRCAAGARLEIGRLPTVVTDGTLVRAVLQNLVSNAAKFTRDGVPPCIAVTGGTAAGGWWVSVADNGRGVPEQERAQVLLPFARGSNATGAQGTGIGLATCARIAERLGGRLEITETPGGGTTVTLRVPAPTG